MTELETFRVLFAEICRRVNARRDFLVFHAPTTAIEMLRKRICPTPLELFWGKTH